MGLAIVILLGICGVLFYIIWKSSQKSESQRKTSSWKPYSKDEPRIENVEAGGVIHLVNIGPNLDEFDVNIIAKHVYRKGVDTWYELEGESADGKVWIDMEEDDGVELAITLKRLKLRDIGVSKRDLERMDEEEDGEIEYQGETYYYEESDSAMFYRYGNEEEGESLYYWDFENEEGTKFIGIERWSDGSYDVSYSETIEPWQVTVYSIGKQKGE